MSASIAVSGIAAQAFRLMEMAPISSFGDDSEQGVSAAEQYPVALDMCLEASDWSFASRVASLPRADEASLDPLLSYAYMRPSDLVRLQDVTPDHAEWRLDADRLRADQPAPILIRYTARITDETRLPGLFKTAVAYRLASLLAPRWTTSANRAQALADQSDGFLSRAAASDRRSASARRYDGDARHGDWSQIATARGGLGRFSGRGF